MNKPIEQRPSWAVLSVRERNLAFARALTHILGITTDKTWNEIRAELTDDKVMRAHEVFGSLWPLDTDLVSLLPKPDGTLRALYTGIIDPRVINNFATSSTAYFDEIIIQNPFMNPWTVKPEHSPVHAPHQHKFQFLRNASLFLTLMPFVDAGFINLIPDPCAFDSHLRQQMFKMAEERSRNVPMLNDSGVMKRLHIDDFKQTMYMLPKEHIRKKAKEAMPDLTTEQLGELLDYMEQEKKNNPLALTEGFFNEKGEGQLLVFNMAPNFEMALYLAQITGSLIITDSQHRWGELMQAQFRTSGMVTYNWRDLTTRLGALQYPLNGDPQVTFSCRGAGKAGKLRAVMHRLYTDSQNTPVPTSQLQDSLYLEFAEAVDGAPRELGKTETSLKGKFSFLIPQGGITHPNVNRLLLTSGVRNHARSVSMAVFMEPLRSQSET